MQKIEVHPKQCTMYSYTNTSTIQSSTTRNPTEKQVRYTETRNPNFPYLKKASQRHQHLSQWALQLQEHIRELETTEEIEYEVTTVNPNWNHENQTRGWRVWVGNQLTWKRKRSWASL